MKKMFFYERQNYEHENGGTNGVSRYFYIIYHPSYKGDELRYMGYIARETANAFAENIQRQTENYSKA